jgi:hypothetical protein
MYGAQKVGFFRHFQHVFYTRFFIDTGVEDMPGNFMRVTVRYGPIHPVDGRYVQLKFIKIPGDILEIAGHVRH